VHCESAPSKNIRVNNSVNEADPLCGKFCVGLGVGVIVSVSVSVKLTSSVVGGVEGEEAQKDCEEQSKRERLQIVVPPAAETCRVFRVTGNATR
jgi:hypothetical protein